MLPEPASWHGRPAAAGDRRDSVRNASVEATASGQASEKRRRRDELTRTLQTGDRLVVSELSRLGRSLGQVVAGRDALAKGRLGVSRLDGKEHEIRHFLELGVSKTAIAKITGVSRTTLYSFMTTRGLRLSR